MPSIKDIRQQYPQYSDMSDVDLATALHEKFYSDMPREQFGDKIGVKMASNTEDVLKSGASGLAEGAVGLVTGPLDLGLQGGAYLANKGIDLATGRPSELDQYPPSMTEAITKGPTKDLSIDYKPQTTAGKVTKTIGEFAPATATLGKSVVEGGVNLAKQGIQKIGEAFPKSVVPNADQFRSIGSGLYEKANQIGGRLEAKEADDFVEHIQKMKPQTELGKAYAGDNEFTKSVDKLSAVMKGKAISLDEAQELDELLGDEIDKFMENGTPTKQGKKLMDIQTAFRSMISKGEEYDMANETSVGKEGFDTLKKARGVWAASRRVADLERIITRAELSPNPDTAIRSGFRALYTNKARMNGFSAEEKEAIRKAAESGIIGDLIGMVGSRLNPIIGWASGAGFGGEAAVAGASIAARGARSAVAVGRAKNAANLVSKNAMNKAGIPLKKEPRFGASDQ